MFIISTFHPPLYIVIKRHSCSECNASWVCIPCVSVWLHANLQLRYLTCGGMRQWCKPQINFESDTSTSSNLIIGTRRTCISDPISYNLEGEVPLFCSTSCCRHGFLGWTILCLPLDRKWHRIPMVKGCFFFRLLIL